jgi:hypothetical protein
MKKNILVLLCLQTFASYAQKTTQIVPDSIAAVPKKEVKLPKELKFNFNDEGSHYLKFTLTNQIWLRYNESNPGTTVYGTPKSETYDVGLRRTRMQLFGQISDRVFLYTQIGLNNLTSVSARKQGLFLHDATGEYKVINNILSLGAGLSGWSGLSRYASPSASSVLTLDVPLYQQATNDATDQFLRKYGVYAKGKLGRFDYRLAASVPMSIQNSTIQTTTITLNSTISSEPAKLQYQGYFMYQFFDKETNLLPYTVGSYLGKKRVLNIGGGFITQEKAMWHLSDSGTDTIKTNMHLFALDIFYDMPISTEKSNAITAYACLSSYDFGKNYLRNVGAMNPSAPATGSATNAAYTGGNAFPMVGTGTTIYAQLGYLFKHNLLGDRGTLQPFVSSQYSQFQLLKNPMFMYEGGVNWLMEGHRSKLSIAYQDRPTYKPNTIGDLKTDSRRGMIVLQFQIAI